MSKLLKYLKKYKIESILAPFFKLIEVTFELIVPLIVSTIIDVGIENGDKVYIIKRCLLLGLFRLPHHFMVPSLRVVLFFTSGNIAGPAS